MIRYSDMKTAPLLALRGVTKTYPSGDGALTVLSEVSLEIPAGQFVAIIGSSGSGKSTLLGLMAGLDRPTSGTVELAEVDLGALDEEGLAAVRNQNIGFVFQSFQLIDSFTALENVAVPLELRGDPKAQEKAEAALAVVGLGKRLHHTPRQLSGGEQQRVAIARATVTAPILLFADEPTGNLDTKSGAAILATLDALRKRTGLTLVLVTHDPAIAARAGRTAELRDGVLVRDTAKRDTGKRAAAKKKK